MMLPSRLGCPLSLKTPNMGNPGKQDLFRVSLDRLELTGVVVERMGTPRHPTFRVMPPDPPELEALPPGSAL